VFKVTAEKLTPAAAAPDDVTRDPSRRQRRRWGRWLLGLGIAILAGIVVLIWVSWLYPRTLGDGPLVLVSEITSAQSLVLVVPAVVALWLAALAWRRRWRGVAGAAAVVAVLALLGVLLPCATQASTAAQYHVPLSLSGYLGSPAVGTPTHTVTYATPGGRPVQLDVWQADRPGPGRPGVVWAHGGGWVSGDRANWSLPRWGRWLADQGITMFSVDYRLPAGGSMSALTPDVKAQEAADVKCALGWVQAHAADYRVDPSNLVLAGDSSGAHLAMLTAYTIGTPSVPPSCPGTVAPVKAVVSLYQQRAESEVSPISYVRRGLPPTLLVQGRNDHVVPPDYSPRLASRLAAAGAEYQLVQLPFTDHVFDIFWGSFSTQIARGVVQQFLDRYQRA
jgi:acetyl esterase/lipase